MANTRHTLGQVEGSGLLLVALKVTGSSGALTNVSGPLYQQNDISCTRSAAGTYAIVIGNFKGPLGSINIQAEPVGTTDRALTVASTSYSGDALTINMKARSITGAPADSDVDFFLTAMAF